MALAMHTQLPLQTPINSVMLLDNSSANEKPKIKLRIRMLPCTNPSTTQSSMKKHSSSTCDENKESTSISEVGEPSLVDYKVDKVVLNSEAMEKKETEKPSKNLMLSIALTKEELEADILAITGGKRIKRKRKKRDREVQRAMKDLFPGHSLCSKNLDYFRQRYRLNGK